MKVRSVMAWSAAIGLVALALPAAASPLVYRPINPTFGGDPLNGSWLAAQASAQTEGGGAPSFSIDFPDFGGLGQDGVTDPTTLPPVNGNGTATTNTTQTDPTTN